VGVTLHYKPASSSYDDRVYLDTPIGMVALSVTQEERKDCEQVFAAWTAEANRESKDTFILEQARGKGAEPD